MADKKLETALRVTLDTGGRPTVQALRDFCDATLDAGMGPDHQVFINTNYQLVAVKNLNNA